jgi:hypothetical protein
VGTWRSAVWQRPFLQEMLGCEPDNVTARLKPVCRRIERSHMDILDLQPRPDLEDVFSRVVEGIVGLEVPFGAEPVHGIKCWQNSPPIPPSSALKIGREPRGSAPRLP